MKSSIPMQRLYWNGLADAYHRLTRISVDDFHYGPQIPGESRLQLLPPLRRGQRALELGCGGAQNSLWLARKGLECTALDLSAVQLRHARRLARAEGLALRLVCSPIEAFSKAVEGGFDLIHSSHALEFVEDPGAVVAAAAERLTPGGTLIISTDHPLYHGDWIDGVYEEEVPGEAPGEAEQGLFLADYFSPPDDVRKTGGRVDVVAHAYPVSSWFRWLVAAGLVVTHLEEPAALPATEAPPYTSDDWAVPDGELDSIPGTLILVARKESSGAAQPQE